MKLKILMGFILGLSAALIMGAAIENSRMEVNRESVEVSVFRPAFSGITQNGMCYLAVTNTITGRSEIFRVPGEALDGMPQKPFQFNQRNSVIVELSRQ